MSGNLTKLEVLQHRHLNLLKTLEAQGIGAHYVDGEWVISIAPPVEDAPLNYGGLPEGAFRMSMAELGLVLTEHFAPVMYCRQEGDEEITMSHATDDMWPTWAKEKFKAVYGMLPSAWDAYYEELQLIEKRINAMLDAHDVSTMFKTRYRIDLLENRITANVEAAKRGDAFKQYVHERLDKMRVPREVMWSEHTAAGCRIGGRLDWLEMRVFKQRTQVTVTSPDGQVVFDNSFDTSHAESYPWGPGQYSINIKREVRADYEPELDVQQEMFMCNYKCVVQASNNEVIFGLDKLPVRTRMTPVIRNLLDTLQAVIVPPSPAKVD